MSGELEAAGAAATAGLAASVIEGRGGQGVSEGACLNCEAPVNGHYCSNCGQATHAHRSLLHMVEEFLHGIIHFDTKAWRTLPMLAFRPGTLTRNYIYGKRARYISPLALFLFTIFLMFFVYAVVKPPVQFDVGDAPPQTRIEAAAALEEARADLETARRVLAEEVDEQSPELAVRMANEGVAVLEGEVRRAEAELARIEAEEARGAPASAREEAEPSAAESSAEEASAEEDDRPWQVAVAEAARNGDITVGTPFPEFNARVLHTLENPDLALYKIQQAAYKFSFLLVPISLPFMWLLFIWKRGLTLYDHTVFVLYSLGFASLVFIVVALTARVPWLAWVAGGLVGLGMPAHMFFQLKGAYALGWWSAIWRWFFLLIFAFIALSIFVASIVLLGLGG